MLFNCIILVTAIVHSYDTDDVTYSQNAVVTRHQDNRLHGVYQIQGLSICCWYYSGFVWEARLFSENHYIIKLKKVNSLAWKKLLHQWNQIIKKYLTKLGLIGYSKTMYRISENYFFLNLKIVVAANFIFFQTEFLLRKLKVSYFQNVLMKNQFHPKYQQKYFWNSALKFFVASWGLPGSFLGFLGT